MQGRRRGAGAAAGPEPRLLHARLAAGRGVAQQPRQVEQQEGEAGGRLGLEAGRPRDVPAVGGGQVVHHHLQVDSGERDEAGERG